jgi:hypothetical protein
LSIGNSPFPKARLLITGLSMSFFPVAVSTIRTVKLPVEVAIPFAHSTYASSPKRTVGDWEPSAVRDTYWSVVKK